MDDREFNTRSENVVRGLLPRIPQSYVDGFEGTLMGGEFEEAIADLVFTVADDQIPITGNERDTLFDLVRDMKDNDELLPKLASVIVDDSASNGNGNVHEPR